MWHGGSISEALQYGVAARLKQAQTTLQLKGKALVPYCACGRKSPRAWTRTRANLDVVYLYIKCLVGHALVSPMQGSARPWEVLDVLFDVRSQGRMTFLILSIFSLSASRPCVFFSFPLSRKCASVGMCLSHHVTQVSKGQCLEWRQY